MFDWNSFLGVFMKNISIGPFARYLRIKEAAPKPGCNAVFYDRLHVSD